MEKQKSPEASKSTTANVPVSTFIGQEAIMSKIGSLIGRARGSQTPFPHTLLIGDDGMGKRTLAHHIAHCLGVKVTEVTGPAIPKAVDVIGVLTNLGRGDILFIDEIHRLSKVVEEFLYPAMENYEIDFVVDKGPYAKTIKFRLNRFTLIATAPDETLVDKQIREQFVCAYKLVPYSTNELLQIVRQELQKSGVTCESGIADLIATACDGNPGRGMKLIRQIVSHCAGAPATQLTASAVTEFLHLTAHDMQLVKESTAERRIADDVKREVWRRDGGKCVRCGSRENLEYDHIIPLSKGGSNTVRNIELLCETCNRGKGDMI